MKSFRLRCSFSLIVVLFAFGIVMVLDAGVADMRPLSEGPPRIGLYFLLRSGVILLLAVAVVADVDRRRDRSSRLTAARRWSGLEALVACLVVVTAAAAAALLAADPELFNRLALEDSIVEWASAIALLAACVLMGAAALGIAFRNHSFAGEFALAFAVSGTLFFIGMEELSWLQRLSNAETPAWLSAINHQREINLHNLATGPSENLYYFGAFIFLVGLPFISDSAPKRPILVRFANFVPSRFVVVIGGMTTPFAFDMWNYVWMQFATFATIFIMIAYARAATRRRPLERVIFTAAAIVVVLVQVIVLARGSAQVRSWDDTEFREMFIAFGMLAYAFETSAVLWRCRCGWAPDR